MTDVLSSRELVEKTFVYMTTLTKECRKALTTSFAQTHKGVPFDSIEARVQYLALAVYETMTYVLYPESIHNLAQM